MSLAVEGKKVCKLICVAVNDADSSDVQKKKLAQQSNKFYYMYEQTDGTFKTERGRVDGPVTSDTFPMTRWDSTVKSKVRKGYKDVTHLFLESVDSPSSQLSDIMDMNVKRLFDALQGYANNSVQENYMVSSKVVTQAQIDEAQAALDTLKNLVSEGNSVDDLNSSLLELYHIIPRRMKDVRDHLYDGDKITKTMLGQIEKDLANEQDTLDVMAGQVLINTGEEDQAEVEQKKSLLDILGVEVQQASDKDVQYVKSLMGPNARQVRAVYAVKHRATQDRFDSKIATASNNKVNHFFHGSRNQNWLNIISTGLMIRPSGAIHNGSMFGDGIYFADKAQKSIGYSSLSGSYWTRGTGSTGYLALFAVHTGKQKHIRRHDHSCYSLCKSVLDRDGYDSVFAEGGIDLRNNEYIVYDNSQCTISFLIEIGN